MQSLCSKDLIANGHLSASSSSHIGILGSYFIHQSEEDDFPLVCLVMVDIRFLQSM
jgi:hypothetical protein